MNVNEYKSCPGMEWMSWGYVGIFGGHLKINGQQLNQTRLLGQV